MSDRLRLFVVVLSVPSLYTAMHEKDTHVQALHRQAQ